MILVLSSNQSDHFEIQLDEEKNYIISIIDLYCFGLTPGIYRIGSNLIHQDVTNSFRCIGILQVSNRNTPAVFAPSHLTYHKLNFRTISTANLQFNSLQTNRKIIPTDFIVRFHIQENNGLLVNLQ